MFEQFVKNYLIQLTQMREEPPAESEKLGQLNSIWTSRDRDMCAPTTVT